MPNTVRVKRSAVSGKVPLTSDLSLGELALNTFDGKLYTLRDNGTQSVVEIGAGGGGASLSAANNWTAKQTYSAYVNLAPGSVPSSPVNGDMWTTATGLFVRINGVTIGPLGTAGAPGWAPVTTTGTGVSQNITLPESGLLPQDVIVNVSGVLFQPSAYSISGTTLTLTAPSGASISIRKLQGPTGPQGPATFRGLSAFVGGVPADNEVVTGSISPYAFTIAPSNSTARATVAATGSTVFTLRNNGTTVGTFTFAAAGTTATLVITGSAVVAVGDYLTIVNQADNDATLANISFLVRE